MSDPAQPRDEGGRFAGPSPTPATGYRWKDFEPGNRVAEKHGANSPRKVDPIADQLASELLELAEQPESPIPYLTSPEYRPAIQAWAAAEAACTLYRQWFSEQGLVDADGEPLPGISNWDKVESRAMNLRQRLGLDPLSRARLGRDVGAAHLDLALLMAERDEDDDG